MDKRETSAHALARPQKGRATMREREGEGERFAESFTEPCPISPCVFLTSENLSS